MHLLSPTTEADMIAVFLKGEIASERFGQEIWARLARDSKSHTIVEIPGIPNTLEVRNFCPSVSGDIGSTRRYWKSMEKRWKRSR